MSQVDLDLPSLLSALRRDSLFLFRVTLALLHNSSVAASVVSLSFGPEPNNQTTGKHVSGASTSIPQNLQTELVHILRYYRHRYSTGLFLLLSCFMISTQATMISAVSSYPDPTPNLLTATSIHPYPDSLRV